MSATLRISSVPASQRRRRAQRVDHPVDQSPNLGAPSSARRSLSAAARNTACNVSAAASAAASSAASNISSTLASVVRTRSVNRRASLPAALPPLVDRPPKVRKVPFKDPEHRVNPLHLHDVGLIRWIFEEARNHHMERPSYHARLADTTRDKLMSAVIFREGCFDVLAAARRCRKAQKAIEHLSDAAGQKAKMKRRSWKLTQRFQKVRSRLFVNAVMSKMLRDIRENDVKAELMWKQWCAGLGSWSLSSAAFASRPCGSISLGLRKYRRSPAKTQPELPDDGSADPSKMIIR